MARSFAELDPQMVAHIVGADMSRQAGAVASMYAFLMEFEQNHGLITPEMTERYPEWVRAYDMLAVGGPQE